MAWDGAIIERQCEKWIVHVKNYWWNISKLFSTLTTDMILTMKKDQFPSIKIGEEGEAADVHNWLQEAQVQLVVNVEGN